MYIKKGLKYTYIYLPGIAESYLQDFLTTVSFEACSVLDHFFFLMFSVQKNPNKLQ